MDRTKVAPLHRGQSAPEISERRSGEGTGRRRASQPAFSFTLLKGSFRSVREHSVDEESLRGILPPRPMLRRLGTARKQLSGLFQDPEEPCDAKDLRILPCPMVVKGGDGDGVGGNAGSTATTGLTATDGTAPPATAAHAAPTTGGQKASVYAFINAIARQVIASEEEFQHIRWKERERIRLASVGHCLHGVWLFIRIPIAAVLIVTLVLGFVGGSHAQGTPLGRFLLSGHTELAELSCEASFNATRCHGAGSTLMLPTYDEYLVDPEAVKERLIALASADEDGFTDLGASIHLFAWRGHWFLSFAAILLTGVSITGLYFWARCRRRLVLMVMGAIAFIGVGAPAAVTAMIGVRDPSFYVTPLPILAPIVVVIPGLLWANQALPPGARIVQSRSEVAMLVAACFYFPPLCLLVQVSFWYATANDWNGPLVITVFMLGFAVAKAALVQMLRRLPNIPIEGVSAVLFLVELVSFTCQRSFVAQLDSLGDLLAACAFQAGAELVKVCCVESWHERRMLRLKKECLKESSGRAFVPYLQAKFTHTCDMLTDMSAELLSAFIVFATRIASDPRLVDTLHFDVGACGTEASLSHSCLIFTIQLGSELATDVLILCVAQRSVHRPRDFYFVVDTKSASWLVAVVIGIAVYGLALPFQMSERAECVFCEVQAQGQLCAF
mmetsp:Transcript_39929/g.124903  ORF Transcript_39929/g.124903 Transcript_39929/m.124903 type:complete len:671 (-) Transcript_39929:70-2082(-)